MDRVILIMGRLGWVVWLSWPYTYIGLGNGPHVLGNGPHVLCNWPHVLGNGPHVLGTRNGPNVGILQFEIMSNSGLCRSRLCRFRGYVVLDYVTFGIMSHLVFLFVLMLFGIMLSGIMSFGIMLFSVECRCILKPSLNHPQQKIEEPYYHNS